MQVTLAVVSSLNGKITKGSDAPAHSWTSPEDWDEFQRLLHTCDVVVMDSKTYDVVRPEPQPERLRVVLTRRPEAYAAQAVPGQLEFINITPVDLIERCKAEGRKHVLLAGARRTSFAFLEAKLVDDFYLTLEPLLFGEGKTILADGPLDVRLTLINPEQLNAQGTVLLHYKVER